MDHNRLSENLNAPNALPAALVRKLYSLPSQTTSEERAYLYCATRWAFSGEGEVFDIGSAAGGSSYCLARGLADGENGAGVVVRCFDLFSGYSRNCFKNELPTDGFADDLAIFRHVTEDVSAFVEPLKMDLTERFVSYCEGRKVEIAHIDAAKSLALWQAIFSGLSTTIIPGKSIWIFQDFERVRLPWQVYCLDKLLAYGEFIGVSPYGTPYFKFLSAPDEISLNAMANDAFSLEEKLSAVDRVYHIMAEHFADGFNAVWPMDDLRQATRAYCRYYAGDTKEAASLYLMTSAAFRAAPEHQLYLKELGIVPRA